MLLKQKNGSDASGELDDISSTRPPHLTLLERCFTIFDRFVSSSLGQPLIVHEEEYVLFLLQTRHRY